MKKTIKTLLLIDSSFDITAIAPVNIPQKTLFSVNIVIDHDKSIIYGFFNDDKIDDIKISFDDGTVISEAVYMNNSYIIAADTTAGIKNIEMHDGKGKMLDNNINNSSYSEFSFIYR